MTNIVKIIWLVNNLKNIYSCQQIPIKNYFEKMYYVFTFQIHLIKKNIDI